MNQFDHTAQAGTSGAPGVDVRPPIENDWTVLQFVLDREFARVPGIYELGFVLRAGGIETGYTDSPDRALRMIREAHTTVKHQGAYIGLNPLSMVPAGRVLGEKIGPGHRADSQIIARRRRILFDSDSTRATDSGGGSMATDEERARAIAHRDAVQAHLTGLGWPDPAQRGDSGNGGFLVYLIDEPNDADTGELIRRVLDGTAKATAGITGAHLDLVVHDAPRIMKLPGTIVAKAAAEGRPRRLASEDQLPPATIVKRDLLEAAATLARFEPPTGALDEMVTRVESALAAQGITVTRKKPRDGGILIALDTCLLAEEPHHTGGACAVLVTAAGLTIWCLTDKCRDRTLRGAEAYQRLGLEMPELVPAGENADARAWIPATEQDLKKLRGPVWAAIRAMNEQVPTLLRRGTGLIKVEWPGDGEPPVTREVREKDDLLPVFHNAARFYKVKELRSGVRVRQLTQPPRHVSVDVLKTGNPPVTWLHEVLTAPVILPGGKLLAKSGYYPETGVALSLPPELEGIDVPDRPEPGQAADALAFIRDLLADFPFTTGWDEGNAVGLMLTPFLRPAINNTVPPFMILANRQGAGKTNLGRALLRPALGDVEFYQAYDASEDERKKLLATLFRDGKSVFGWDNVTGTFKSPTLAALVTTKELTLRILGSPEQAVAPAGTIAVLTGNGVQFDADMRERMARIRISVDMEHPSDRPLGSFRYPNVWDLILENRRQVVEAALTVALHWWSAGQPRPAWIAPRNTEWSRHIHGALQAAGWPAEMPNGRGYAQGHGEVREADEIDDQPQRVLVSGWWERHQDEATAPKALVDLAHDAGIEFGRNGSDPAVRLKQLSQTVLPQMDGMVYEIEDAVTVKVGRAKGKRGVRTLWKLTLLERSGGERAAPAAPAAPSRDPGKRNEPIGTNQMNDSPWGSLTGAASAAGAAPSASNSFGDMTEGAM